MRAKRNAATELARLGWAAGAVAALAACTALPGGARLEGEYPTQDLKIGGIVQPDGPTEGQPPGGNNGKARTYYVFHVHGMGLTSRKLFHEPLVRALTEQGYARKAEPTDWTEARLRQTVTVDSPGLKCTAGWTDPFDPDPGEDDGEVSQPCAFSTFGKYRIDHFYNGQDTVHLYTYYWHRDLWRIQEPHLGADMRRPRAPINRMLKRDVIDGGLSDAAAYIGPAGRLVRAGMESVLCRMARDAAGDGSPDSPSQVGAGLSECRPKSGGEFVAGSEVEFNFVSHSLGSRMLFDVLVPPDEPAKVAELGRPGTARAFIVDRTRSVFMAANQLALLQIGFVTVSGLPGPSDRPAVQQVFPRRPECRSAVPLLAARCAITGPKAFGLRALAPVTADKPPLRVVGFLDPNDVLGFKASDGRSETDRLAFVNIIHRNTSVWFGAFANPKAAHDRELETSDSRRMIICGATITKAGRVEPRNCPRPAKAP